MRNQKEKRGLRGYISYKYKFLELIPAIQKLVEHNGKDLSRSEFQLTSSQ